MANFTDHPLKAQDLLWRSQVECCIATFSPAVIRPSKLDCNGFVINGSKKYYENDKIHRPSREGPAVIRSNGDEFYYENGELINT